MTSTIDLITNTTDRVFIDSNILVYSYDDSQPYKKALAQEIMSSLARNENGAMSVQVLGEFFRIVTRRIANPLSIEQAEAAVVTLGSLPALEVLNIDLAMVRRAIATHNRYGVNYWDSLIIAAAERAGCSAILSEDFNTGQLYHSILAVNPFAAEPA